MTQTPEFPSVSPKLWKQKIIEELKGKPYEDLIWHTKEGFDVQPFYTEEDLEKFKIVVLQKQKPGWEVQQDIVVKDVKEANKRALEALASGVESIGFDAAKIQITKSNLQKLLAGINTAKTPVHFTGVKIKSLEKLISVFTKKTSGSIAFADFSEKNIPALTAYSKKFPAFDFITIKLKSTQNTTAWAPLSIGEWAGVRLLKKRVRISVPLSSDFFLSIAKLHAIRLFFSEKNIPVFIHTENLSQITAKGEEHYNILRATTTAMAAIIGGCDSVSLKASPIPGKSKAFSERIYRNIQLLLKHESYFDKLENAAGSSYYIEALTQKLYEQFSSTKQSK